MSITYIILGATVILSLSAFNNNKLFERFLFSPYLVKKNNEWDRFIGHGFIHVDYMHLFFNMFVLYFFGQNLEEAFKYFHGNQNGALLFGLLYVSGIAIAALPSFNKHKDNYYYRSVGASGAVSAVLFAHIMLMPTVPLYLFFIPIPIPSFIFGVLYLIYEYYLGKKGNSAVAHDAHIGGAIFGVVFTILTIDGVFSSFLNQILKYIS